MDRAQLAVGATKDGRLSDDAIAIIRPIVGGQFRDVVIGSIA